MSYKCDEQAGYPKEKYDYMEAYGFPEDSDYGHACKAYISGLVTPKE